MKVRARIRLLAALVAAACSSDPTGGGEILVVSQIDVQPPGATVVVGGTQQLSATPKTSSGITVPNRTVAWSSEDQGIATVSTVGLVTGVSVGSAVITARVDDITRDVTINVTPKPVASVSVEPPQVSISVGGSQQLTATPRDAQGQALQDRPVTFTSDNLDVATVSATGLVTGVAAGATTIRATVEGRTGTSSITVTPRPATRLAFTTQPTGGTAGQALGPIRVTVQDALGGTVSTATTGITLSIANNAGGATLGGTLTVNAVAGVATFSTVTVDKPGAGYTLRASAGALSPAISSPFTIAAGAAARLAMVTQPSATTTSGAPLAVQPVVRIIDANGNPVPQGGTSVTVQIVGAGATLAGNLTVETAANGTATFTNLSLSGPSGTYSLRFIATGLIEVTSNPIAISQGTATQLGLLTAPSSTAQSGVPFPQQPVIELRDAGNNPVAQAGVQITVAVAAGGGTLSGVTTVITNSGGQAAFSGLALAGTAGGGHALVFSAPGLGQVITDPITLTAGPAPTLLTITTQPSATAASGAAFAQQPAIQARDASNNPVAQAGIPVTAAIATGGGSLLGTVTVNTNASGVATFTNLAISGTVGPRTIRFTSPGLTQVTSGTITITAGAADRLGLTTQPSAGASSGVPFPQQPVVQVTDASGNPVSQAGTAITVSVETGAGGTLGGTTVVVTNASGQAAFTNLALSGASGVYTLRFSATGLTHVISSSIGLGAGAPTKLAITTQPSASVQNGVNFPQQPAIQLQDAGSNPVAQAGVQVTVTIQSGNPALSGTLSALTNASGLATFTDLRITGLVGNRTLLFASSGLVSVASGTISVVAGPAQTIAANSAGSQSATVATAVAAPPSVLVTDVSGNPVSGLNVTFTVTGGGGTITPASPATIATGVDGVAALTAWTLGTTAGANNNSVTAAAAVPNGSPVTFTATATAGAANSIAANSVTSQSATINTAVAAPPSVVVTDAFGNPKSGVNVTFTVTGGGGSTSPASPAIVSTGVDGVASLASWTLGSGVGTDNNSVTGTAAVPNGSPVTFTASGTAPPPTTIAPVSATSQSATVNTVVGAPPSVKVTDAGGNPVAGVSVTFSVTGGGGSISPASPAIIATDAGGIATLASWTLGTTAGVDNNTVSATAAVPNGSPVVFTATATAGAASTIAANSAVTQSATAGSNVTPPSVIVTDEFGNPVGGVDVTFTLTADGNGGSIAPGSPAVVTTNSSGVASLATWTLGTDVGTDNNAVEATAAVPNGSPVAFTASGTAESGSRAARTLSQLLLRL